MFAISEVAPNGSPTGQTQSQQQLIASVIAQQRVIAARAGAESGDASAQNFSGSNERERAIRNAERARQRNETGPQFVEAEVARQSGRSAEAQSIVEAQEASMTNRKIVAAFQARLGLADLLSVIRDPEDLLLPVAPKP